MLAIENLSRSEKLRMMEALWENLSRDNTVLASPEWHGEALKEAEVAHASGKANFVDWEAAKQTLRENKT
jgi:hypothetical protein